MFEDVILHALAEGPMRTQEIYEYAERHRPEVCTPGLCTRRNRESATDLEWHHLLRHSQSVLQQQGRIIRGSDGRWVLVEPAQ